VFGKKAGVPAMQTKYVTSYWVGSAADDDKQNLLAEGTSRRMEPFYIYRVFQKEIYN
jgi:hypothetical protein